MKPLFVTVNGQTENRDQVPSDAALPFAVSFPRWINRWSFLILLLCLLPALFLLFVVRRPVYTELPLKTMAARKSWQLSTLVDSGTAGWNQEGDRVEISLPMNGGGKMITKGVILSVLPATNGLYRVTISAERPAKLNESVNEQPASALLQTATRSVAEKIFTNP